jgi:hypothetical protein
MTITEATGRVVGTVLGTLVLILARPIARFLYEWEED